MAARVLWHLCLASLVILLFFAPFQPYQLTPAAATHDPVDFTILATITAWNASATPNPTIIEFRGVIFTVSVMWVDVQHNFAIYQGGTVSSEVDLFDQRLCSQTPKCLAESRTVTSASPTDTLSFTPTVPADDSTGPGGYEYYCEIHPTSMHGKLRVFKSPDINANGRVDIVDAAILGQAYLSVPGDVKWNPNADLNNNGRVDITDAAILGSVYPKVLVD